MGRLGTDTKKEGNYHIQGVVL